MLVVVYFITDRQISPHREMSKAAREFAAGRDDSRITVSGTDEVAELAVGLLLAVEREAVIALGQALDLDGIFVVGHDDPSLITEIDFSLR